MNYIQENVSKLNYQKNSLIKPSFYIGKCTYIIIFSKSATHFSKLVTRWVRILSLFKNKIFKVTGKKN